jgi:uncharacterized membrane protein YesL
MSNRVSGGFVIKFEHYFAAFKQYFVKSWLVTAPLLLIVYLIVLNISFYGAVNTTWAVWAQGAWLAAMLFVFGIQFYVMPFLVEQEDKSIRTALRNSALVAGANPLYTFVLLLTGVLPLFLLFGCSLWTMFANAAVHDRITEVNKRRELAAQGKNKR